MTPTTDEMQRTIKELKAELGALKKQNTPADYKVKPTMQAPLQAPQYQQQAQGYLNKDAPSAMEIFAGAITQMYMAGTQYFQAMAGAVKELKGLYQMQGMKPAYAGAEAGASPGYSGTANKGTYAGKGNGKR